MTFTAPMTRRRKILVLVVGVGLVLFGAASLWQSGRAAKHAHMLLLDPQTGETLHDAVLDGGYALPALLADGRVAVATLDSCPDGKGGSITVFDATLKHVVSRRSYPPCGVARLDPGGLRKLVGEAAGAPFGTTIRLGQGRLLVMSVDGNDALGRPNRRVTVYDDAGDTLWTRDAFDGRLGVMDARGGRIAVTAFGDFTPGSD
jgi:hypothetical protein